MKMWTRWEDWVAVAIGVIVALSALFMPAMGASVAIMVTLGVLLIVSPWIGGYADPMTFGPAWMSWIGGAIVVIVAALAIRPAMRAHQDAIPH